jgi:Icc-related predicted phosphoesterase
VARDPKSSVRVAATGDLHCREDQHGRFRNFVKHVNEVADVLLLCGDLTDRGKPEEAKTLAEDLSALRIPAWRCSATTTTRGVASKQLCAELAKANVHFPRRRPLRVREDPGDRRHQGVRRGLRAATLQAFGEGPTKAFVQEGVNESLKLEAALGSSRPRRRW